MSALHLVLLTTILASGCARHVVGKKSVPQFDALQNSYDEYNAKYFDNKLSHEVRITYGVLPKDFMGLTEHDQWGYHIGISKQYNPSPRQAKGTLIHEMCHIFNVGSQDLDDHGPDWHLCMRNLAAAGAWDDLW